MLQRKEEEATRLLRQQEEAAMIQKKLEAEEMIKKQRREAEKEAALRRVAELRQQEANDLLLTKQRIEEQAKVQKEQAMADVVSNQAAAVSQLDIAAAAPISAVNVDEAKIERDVTEQNTRSFSPFPKKQSSSPSSKLPYAASKTVDETNTEEVQSLEVSIVQEDVNVGGDVAEQKRRSFSPYAKKQSSSPSSKLPYAASKTVDETATEEGQSIWSLGKSFFENIIHDLTPQNEVSIVQQEISGDGSNEVIVNSNDGEHIENDATQSMAVETRSYSPFQESEKTTELRKEAMLRAQEAIVRLRRQEEINETLARKLRIERDVAEKKSRSFSPFVKKESTSSSSTLPYAASVSDSAINSESWTPGKAVHL